MAWQHAKNLALAVYRATESMPKAELYGLTSQMRRAVVSIPANVAEGYGRKHRAEYLRFLSIASGSLTELETLLILATEVCTLPDTGDLMDHCATVGKLLTKLMQSLKPCTLKPCTLKSSLNGAGAREPFPPRKNAGSGSLFPKKSSGLC